MTDWAILAAAITGAPSVAAVLVVLIISRHRKWADGQARSAADRAAEAAGMHQHLWGRWAEYAESEWESPLRPGVTVDTRTEFRRRCDTCGDVQLKTWSERDQKWL